MSVDAQKLHIISNWLSAMSKLCRHRQGRLTDDGINDFKNELSLYASMLAQDPLPSGAFTTASLHAVLQGHSFFPAYEDIRGAVQTWWNDHRPASAPLLAGSSAGEPGLVGMDLHWINFWHRRRGEMFADGYRPQRGSVDADIANLASLIRQQAPVAWAVIANVPRPARQPPSDETIARVRAAVAEAEAALATADQVAAPQRPLPDVAHSGARLGEIRLERASRSAPVQLSPDARLLTGVQHVAVDVDAPVDAISQSVIAEVKRTTDRDPASDGLRLSAERNVR